MSIFDGYILISDIDGTLATKEMRIPPENLKAIEYFKEKGGLFTLASGRSFEAVRPYAKAASVNCPAIVYNGGGIYDFDHDTMLWQKFLPNTTKAVVKAVMKEFPSLGVEVHANGIVYLVQYSDEADRHIKNEWLEHKKVQLEDLSPEHGWNKVLFAGPPSLLKEVCAFTGEIPHGDAYFIFTSDVYYEYIPNGADKGNALRKLSEKLQIPIDKTHVIGDYYNDILLLEAGGVAAAVKGAPDELVKLAEYISCDCEHGAVADFIRYIKQKITSQK